MKPLTFYRQSLKNGSFDHRLCTLYGEGEEILKRQKQRYLDILDRAVAWFSEQDSGFDPETTSVIVVTSPGRTELLGNHTDHNHGRVLTAAIDLDSVAVAYPRNDKIAELYSLEYNSHWQADLSQNIDPVELEFQKTPALLRGSAGVLRDKGDWGGYRCYISSRIPPGAGISSSASLEVLLLTLQNTFYNRSRLSPLTLCRLAQEMENRYFGKASGLMDQMGCGMGGVLSIDFKDPVKPVYEKLMFHPVSLGYRMFLVDTRGTHEGLGDGYASMPGEMKLVAEALGQEVLRNVSEDAFLKKIPELRESLSDRAINRALHFFNENKRVQAVTSAVKSMNISDYIGIMQASGDSSILLLQNIVKEGESQNQELAMALGICRNLLKGQGACRVHGGGLAGTIQVLAPIDTAETIIETMTHLFGQGAVLPLRLRDSGVEAL